MPEDGLVIDSRRLNVFAQATAMDVHLQFKKPSFGELMKPEI
jgi:hypothetical protein